MSENVAHLKTTEKQHDAQLQAEVRRVMETESITQTALSQLTGVGKTRISQWLNSRYTGDVPALEADIRRWLESRRVSSQLESQLPAAPGWVETVSARQVISALTFAQMAGAVSVIYGGAGVGKTSTVEQYQTQAPNVWLVTATPACSSTGALLKRVAQTLGMRSSGTVDHLETAIIERMRDTRGLLVIDEAQHLTHRALDGIRSIHDASGVGLALMGNEIVYSQLTGGTRSLAFAQLFSRVAKRVRLTRVRDQDVLAITEAWGIKDDESRQLCLSIGRRPGALRGLSQTLRLASMFAAGSGSEAPQLEHIREAWSDLGGET